MKTIIFDMDGTILDTIVDITNAVNYILEKNGMPKRTVDEVKFFVGNGLYKTLERSVPEGTNEEVVKGIYEEMVAYYKAHSDINTKPYDGLIDVIKEIKKRGYNNGQQTWFLGQQFRLYPGCRRFRCRSWQHLGLPL